MLMCRSGGAGAFRYLEGSPPIWKEAWAFSVEDRIKWYLWVAAMY